MIVTSSPTTRGGVALAVGVVTLVLARPPVVSPAVAPSEEPATAEDESLSSEAPSPAWAATAASFTRERSLRVDLVGALPAALPTAAPDESPESGSVGLANATGMSVAAAATEKAAVVHWILLAMVAIC